MRDVIKGFLISFIPGLIILIAAVFLISNLKSANVNKTNTNPETEVSENVSVSENNEDNKPKDENNKNTNYTVGNEITFQGTVSEINYNKDGSIIIEHKGTSYKVMKTEDIRLNQTIWIKGIVISNTSQIEVETRELKVIS